MKRNLSIKRGLIQLLFQPLFLLTASIAFGQQKPLPEAQRIEFDKYFFNGMREKLIGNYADAESNFLKASEIDPNNANNWFQLSSTLLQSKQVAKAEIFGEKAAKLDPANEWYTRQLVDIYRYNRNYNKAEELLSAHYKATKNPDVLFELGMIQHQGGNYKKALKSFDAYEKVKGISEGITRQKEQIYLQMNKPAKAIDEVKKLIAAFPDNLQFKGALADLYMATRKEKEALAIYQEIIQKEPKNGYAAFALAEYYKNKGDKNLCYSWMEKGLSGEADIKTKLNVLTEIIPGNYFEPEHLKTCQNLLETFEKAHPGDPSPYILQGDLYLQDRNFEQARERYLKATGMQNAGILSWEQVLQCDQLMQRYDLMLEDCSKVIELFPSYAPAYLFSSIAAMSLKKYLIAENSARKGVEYADNDELKSQLLSSLADAAHYNGHYTTSDSAYDEALLIDPENAYAMNNYAYFLSLRNERLDKAEQLSRKSISIDPKNASYQDTYGWIQYQLKNYSEARNYIERSLQLSPENPEVTEHLGDVLFKLGQEEDALAQWKKAAGLGNPSEALLKKIKERKLQP